MMLSAQAALASTSTVACASCVRILLNPTSPRYGASKRFGGMRPITALRWFVLHF